MKRILLMVFRNLWFVPWAWCKLCYRASHTDKYTEEEQYSFIRWVDLHANKGGNVKIDVRQAMKVIIDVSKEVEKGRNYLIFPEGTRSKNGNKIGTFKGGSFKAATKAKCPIVPVALINSFVPFDRNTIRPVTVQVHFLKPLEYEDYKEMKTTEIAALVEKQIQEMIDANVEE